MRKWLTSKVKNLTIRWHKRSPNSYIKYLRRLGVVIGDNVWMTPDVYSLAIDTTRPSLISIGSNVRLNKNLTILTHDGGYYVLLNKYREFVSQSGKVEIGNNVYFGRNCTVFKGVTIGDNCIIGFGSVVTKSIPPNSVAVGSPAKVVSTVEDYYRKRKSLYINEALEYARSIQTRFGRKPVLSDFWEEFPLFLHKEELPVDIPVKEQMGRHYEYYRENHEPYFNSFEEFLSASENLK